jgi:endonuclease/exonuclease/phosphatase family metal-dependent hydrolase
LSYLRTSGAGARLRWAGLFGLIAALSLCLMPGIADAKKGKKKDLVKVMTQNLYLGTDLNPLIAAANAGQPGPNATTVAAPDNFANEVGFGLKDVLANDFNVRARTIASEIKKNKVDLVGLQEAALWRLEVPTDGGGPPVGTLATVPLIDYIDTLVNALNEKAKTKKACKKKGLKGNKCYRGYTLVGVQQEADLEQFGDFDNDPGPDGIGGSGPGFPPPCTGAPGTLAAAVAGYDDTGVSARDPGPGPAAANLDYNGDFNAGVPPPNCNPLVPAFNPDPAGTSDCASNDLGDTNPIGGNTPTCVINGIDGDVRLTTRDVILARKGAGVKTSNVTGANYSPADTLALPLFGGAASAVFTRGWVSADVSVRGKKFHLVNTHLESENTGSIREDQASELVASGGPATATPTILLGDLNSDPQVAPGDLPNGDADSNIAYNRLVAAGFRSLSGSAATFGHTTGAPAFQDVLNDLSKLANDNRIDHILTNSPSITAASVARLDGQGGGLWASDHAGLLSRLKIPGGKKKK